jgi:hypothetical protein
MASNVGYLLQLSSSGLALLHPAPWWIGLHLSPPSKISKPGLTRENPIHPSSVARTAAPACACRSRLEARGSNVMPSLSRTPDCATHLQNTIVEWLPTRICLLSTRVARVQQTLPAIMCKDSPCRRRPTTLLLTKHPKTQDPCGTTRTCQSSCRWNQTERERRLKPPARLDKPLSLRGYSVFLQRSLGRAIKTFHSDFRHFRSHGSLRYGVKSAIFYVL